MVLFKSKFMSRIHLNTVIHAPLERVFDLSRSIDFHMVSMANTKERAIAGRMTGLVEEGDTVTWEATHLGVKQNLTSWIHTIRAPYYFADSQVKGAFRSLNHEHFYHVQEDGSVLLTDIFDFESPLGILGRFFNWIYLKGYMKRFLEQRNRHLKAYCEGEGWKKYLQ